MYQVTAMYMDAEISYAEAGNYEDAARECADGVPEIYPDEDVVLVCTQGILTVETPLDIHRHYVH